MTQWVKDLALSLLWLRSQLWRGFYPSPVWELLHAMGVAKKKKKKRKKKKKTKNNKEIPWGDSSELRGLLGQVLLLSRYLVKEE